MRRYIGCCDQGDMWIGLPILAINESLTASFSFTWLTMNESEAFVNSNERVERVVFAWHAGLVLAL